MIEFVLLPLTEEIWCPVFIKKTGKREEIRFYVARKILVDDRKFAEIFYRFIFCNPLTRNLVENAKYIRFEPFSLVDRIEVGLSEGKDYMDLAEMCDNTTIGKRIKSFYKKIKFTPPKNERYTPKASSFKSLYEKIKTEQALNAIKKYRDKLIY